VENRKNLTILYRLAYPVGRWLAAAVITGQVRTNRREQAPALPRFGHFPAGREQLLEKLKSCKRKCVGICEKGTTAQIHFGHHLNSYTAYEQNPQTKIKIWRLSAMRDIILLISARVVCCWRLLQSIAAQHGKETPMERIYTTKNVDYTILWDTVQTSLPELKDQLTKLVKTM